MTIDRIVLDFDGTCTQIPPIQDKYKASFLEHLKTIRGDELGEHWESALELVRSVSPEAGWHLGGLPSAPAAADPFIHAGEAARILLELLGKPVLSDSACHRHADDANPTDWREEAREVFSAIQDLGVTIFIVSSSGTDKINSYLERLFPNDDARRRKVTVLGGAAKYKVQDLSQGESIPESLRRRFDELPREVKLEGLNRQVQLRRGAFFEKLCSIWGEDLDGPEKTLFCGDIWELDLAMPAALGLPVHLITRAKPYTTYKYELEAARAKGTLSEDLNGLVEQARRLRGGG